MRNNVKEMNVNRVIVNKIYVDKAFEIMKRFMSIAVGLSLVDFMLKHLYV